MEENENLVKKSEDSDKKLHLSDVIHWVAIEKCLPENYDIVLVCYDNGTVNTDEYINDHFTYGFSAGLFVRYWSKLPKPPYV